MSESADSSSDETISYLKDVDSNTGESYADAEPPTGPRPYMHEPQAVFVRVELEDAPSNDGSADAVPHDTSRSGNLFI